MSGNDRLKCSFCGKTQDQVKKLIAGPDVFICDECVELCNEILDEEFFEGKEKNLEGKEGDKYIDEYCDASTERGKKLREIICKELKLTTLAYQSISGLIEAIGLPEDCVCTYCWNGKG